MIPSKSIGRGTQRNFVDVWICLQTFSPKYDHRNCFKLFLSMPENELQLRARLIGSELLIFSVKKIAKSLLEPSKNFGFSFKTTPLLVIVWNRIKLIFDSLIIFHPKYNEIKTFSWQIYLRIFCFSFHAVEDAKKALTQFSLLRLFQ